MFYIGDADPFGIEIFFTYMFGSARNALCENVLEVRPAHSLTPIGPFISDFMNPQVINQLKLTEKDKQKAYTLLTRPYLSDKFLDMHSES
jgi:DNA topoisomerase VI subunit A